MSSNHFSEDFHARVHNMQKKVVEKRKNSTPNDFFRTSMELLGKMNIHRLDDNVL